MQRLRSDDRGAVAVLVAICMTALLGVGALVVDVGQVYAERRQLQNGADAAVLSLAVDCPTTAGCNTDLSLGGQAGAKADQNDADPANIEAQVTEICGNAATLTPCSPASDIGPWDCRPVPTALASASYVQVRTQTRRDGGGNLVPPLLSRLLIPGYTGTNVRACARASWGAPASLASGLPLIISDCEFKWITGGGYAPPPPYPPYPASFEKVTHFHSQDGPSPCPTSGSGAQLPGGFGWLDTGAACDIVTNENGDPTADPGVSPPSSCSPEYLKSLIGKIINVPVYDSATLNGNNGTYNVKGYAAFVLTGYWFTGQYREPSIVSGTNYCKGDERCIYGFFTQDLTPASGTIGSSPNMGVTVVQMSG